MKRKREMTKDLDNLGCCELCGIWGARHKHHFMSGRNRRLKTGQRNDAGVRQRIIKLCPKCHDAVHGLPADKFHLKYAIPKSKFLYTSKPLDINGLPVKK